MPLRSIRAGDVKEVDVWDFDANNQLFTARQEAPVNQLPDLIRPHRITYFAIRWIIKGEIKAHVDHVPYELGPNTLMLANPQQISWFTPKMDNPIIEVRLVVFTEQFLSHLNLDQTLINRIRGTLNHFVLQLEKQDVGVFEHYFELIGKEAALRMPVRDQILAPLVESLLRRISLRVDDHATPLSSSSYQSVYRDFLDLLEKKYQVRQQVGDYAEELTITERQLTRVCQTIAGLSPGKIIQNRIDFEAKRLLQHTAYSAKEIGFYLGFHDAAHFTKFFQRHNGVSPIQYRNGELSDMYNY